jgi:hypothetical protein
MLKHPEIPPDMENFFVKDKDGEWCFRLADGFQQVQLQVLDMTDYRIQKPEVITVCAAMGFYGWNKAVRSGRSLSPETCQRLADEWRRWEYEEWWK